MKTTKVFGYILAVITMLFVAMPATTFAQRPMEKLGRSVVAQKVSNGVYVNWRLPSEEWYNTTYKLYRDGSLIHTTTANGASNFLDASGTVSSTYTVTSIKNGVESSPSAIAAVMTKPYFEIPLRDIKKLGKYGYYPNDATAADLDGDGEYEIILKRMKRDWSQSCTDFTYFEAYKQDGTFLWAIDVGPNITMDVEINIAAFDFDGDGKAEVFMRSSDNTIFGLDINNQGGISVGDRDGDGYTNYRLAPFNGVGGDGFMNAGPEYLSLIDGMTGKELDWANFIPRGNSNDWGDGYGHRANKFFFGAPYLDGLHPSLFTGRGIYTMTKMQTYDVVNKKLVKKWYWESTSPDIKQQGKYDTYPKSYFGQGYHNYTIADVDGDGKDEVNWGSMTIDDDGKPLYSSELGHGDAQHYGDLDPYRPGQEMFACNETKPGTNLRDAKTGQILYRHITPSDCGRCCAANVTDAFKGAEIWGGGKGVSATDRVDMNSFGLAENYRIYWDGDLLEEICDHTDFSTSTGVGYGKITKFISYGNVMPLLTADAYSCNYTKGTPCLQADLVGDWREEVIWWRKDSLALRIYTTPIPTTNRIYTLMHDHQYRQAICWQMCGYNQPPHTSFYLGSDFPTPIPAKSTNGKIVWNGNSSVWDTTTPNWMDGNDEINLLAGTSTPISFADGKSVLFDNRASNRDVQLSGTLSPEILTISSAGNYKIGGNGTLAGSMRLDKMGDSTLVLSGNHTYSGATNVWEGNLWMDGTLTSSPIIVRRHSNYGGNGMSGNGIETEYNAGVYIGGMNKSDTMKVNGNIHMVAGAKMIFDLSDNPTIPAGNNSSLKNDHLILNGNLILDASSIIVIHQMASSLPQGEYLLAHINAAEGDLSKVKISGIVGTAAELKYIPIENNLYLVIKGVRTAGKITWSGNANSDWDIAKTSNWLNLGYSDIFVSNDSVLFDSSSSNRTVNITDSIPAAYVEVSSADDYIFDGVGAITGNAALHKTSSGTLTINNRNTFTGKTVVEGGGILSLKYAPAETNVGGIGPNTTDPSYLILKDSSVLQITTANEITSRGMTVEGAAGGVLNTPASLYWYGAITGTVLTKNGTGTLYLSNNNSSLNETVLSEGKIILNTSSYPYGVGKKATLLGGTLEAANNIGAYLSSNTNYVVPAGYTANVVAAPRCEYNGTLSGEGTLNWSCDYIRAYINGNWSGFTGNLNINANSANSTYENHFIVNSANGFSNATITLGSGVRMCYKNGTSDNGRTKIKVGLLKGNAGAEFYNADLEVGANNLGGIYSGSISGSTAVTKVGTGIWTISGTNSYTGTTTVNGGTLYVYSSIDGTGSVIVNADAVLNLRGSVAGMVNVNQNGAVYLFGTANSNLVSKGLLIGTGTIKGITMLNDSSITRPANLSYGTLNFGSSVTMSSGATLEMQIGGGSSLCDNLDITGALTCNGTLDVILNAGTLALDNSYQLFNAGSISGTFANIKLPELSEGLQWDLSQLYTSGIIKVINNTGVYSPNLKIGIEKNPSEGIFRIFVENETNFRVQVADMSGKKVYDKYISTGNGKFQIDLSEYASGIFLLNISSSIGYNTLKLIKK